MNLKCLLGHDWMEIKESEDLKRELGVPIKERRVFWLKNRICKRPGCDKKDMAADEELKREIIRNNTPRRPNDGKRD